MDWQQLLNPQRLGITDTAPADAHRSPFQKDWDRIIFSAAFRRLQDKTQVHPLPVSDYVRTRLTHSLEVSSVGRSLGAIVGRALIPRYGIRDMTPGDFGDIVAAACLAHDIGNPPFGHAGEEAIQAWFKQHPDVMRNLTDAQRQDFLRFEGNAQGFRTLVRLQHFEQPGGLQLTCATLAAFTKYPRASSLESADITRDVSAKKFGFFQSEAGWFAKVAQKTGLKRHDPAIDYWARHPLAFLLEAADDICYTIIDFEDGFKLGKLHPNEVEAGLLALLGKKDPGRTRHISGPDRRITYLRAKAIGALVENTAAAFLAHETGILAGTFREALLPKTPQYETFREICDVTRERVYFHHGALLDGLRGMDIIGGLLTAFWQAVQAWRQSGNWRRLPQEQQHLLNLVILKDPGSVCLDDDYACLQLITDYISGMTDTFAMDLYRRVQHDGLPASL